MILKGSNNEQEEKMKKIRRISFTKIILILISFNFLSSCSTSQVGHHENLERKPSSKKQIQGKKRQKIDAYYFNQQALDRAENF